MTTVVCDSSGCKHYKGLVCAKEAINLEDEGNGRGLMCRSYEELKSQTPEAWLKEFEELSCYTPAPPFFDFCNRYGHPDSGHDCVGCRAKHNLQDYIE